MTHRSKAIRQFDPAEPIKFTEPVLRAIRDSVKDGRVEFRDSEEKALRLRVSPTSASWYVLKRSAGGPMVRALLGKADDISIEKARKLAAVRRAELVQGVNPNAAKRARQAEAARNLATLGSLLTAYVEHLNAQGKQSWREVESSFRRNLSKPYPALTNQAAAAVTVDDVMPALHRLTKKGQWRAAEKLRAYLRAAYAAAKKARTDAAMHAFSGLGVTANPLADLNVTRPKQAPEQAARAAKERKWALTEDQLRAYWQRICALPDPDGALLRFHLLTGGQRVKQLARITTASYDADRKTVTLWDAKGRRRAARAHVIPLIPEAIKAIGAMRGEGEYLFTATGGKAPTSHRHLWGLMGEVAAAMVEAGEIDREFTPGVIRKTVETRLAAKGVSKDHRAHLLSHGLGGVQDEHYDAHEYDDEKREALLTLRRMLDPKGKVVPFKRKRA